MEQFANLRELISDMELPGLRQQVRDLGDVAWLSRNMGILNKDNPNLPAAMKECAKLLKFI